MLINQQLESREFLREYKDRSIILGKEIRVLPAVKPGVERDFDEGTAAFAADIDQDGGLVVRYEDGSLKTLTTGEISIRLIN
jgi:BirA family biotin operon repressor/biotin-[acetyl-CoA-carboxylase] ligase